MRLLERARAEVETPRPVVRARRRAIAAVTGVVLLIGLLVAGARPAARDLDSIADTTAVQRALLDEQLRVTRQQLGAIGELVALQQRLLERSRALGRTTASLDEQLAALRELTRQILEELRELNRKTGPVP